MIIGLGITGLSCARYLRRKGLPFIMLDTREAPAAADAFREEFPDVQLICGALNAEQLKTAKELIVSPGVSIRSPAIAEAIEAGVSVIGDIELFCREVSAPIIAITGSNAKSTVTTLVGEMAKQAGIDVAVGGNLGTPVLDMLAEAEQKLYVLELSSFQLETTHSLKAEVATVLNVTPDHMDRYRDFQDYHLTKHRIYRGCKIAVSNADDPLTQPLLAREQKSISFRLAKPDFKEYGVVVDDQGVSWLTHHKQPLFDLRQLKIAGKHNQMNALAALVLARSVGIPQDAINRALVEFTGLEHRCQWVAEIDQITYINDSKGTNVGATEAALIGLGESLADGKIVLIAGGVGKGADFSALKGVFEKHLRGLVLIGEDAEKLAAVSQVKHCFANSMAEAVQLSREVACAGDIVLLSPACASFDMFSNYNQRGECFVEAVKALS